MDSFRTDLRIALRTLRKRPVFAATAILLVALSVGAATSTFGVVNAVLLRPLPYDDPGRLVALNSVFRTGEEVQARPAVRLVDVQAWEGTSLTVESGSAFGFTYLPVQVGDRPFMPGIAITDPRLLPTLGSPLASGSNFAVGDTAESEATAIVSNAFRILAFGEAGDVLGRSITINGSSYIIRGVLKEDFQFPRPDARSFRMEVDILIPAPGGFSPESSPWRGIARLRPGVSVEQLNAELASFSASVAEQSPDREGWFIVATPLDAETTAEARQPLLMLLAISAALVLIACTNLTNLLLARSSSRSHEMGIRAAVGGTAARLVWLQLTESMCLTLLGGVLGVALAAVATRVLAAILPVFLPVSGEIGVDLAVVGFAFSSCVVIGLVAGFASACAGSWRATRFGQRNVSSVSVRALPRGQQSLCVAQVALCVGLLAAAGVLTHSLWNLNTIDTGFDAEAVLTFQVTVPPRPHEARQRFANEAIAEIEAIPGVTAAAFATHLPPESTLFVEMSSIDGSAPPDGAASFVNTLTASRSYFSILGMTVLRGRSFDVTDDANALPIAVVNEEFIRVYLRERADPIGAEVEVSLFGGPVSRQIVGVVNDTRHRNPRNGSIPVLYVPHRQAMSPYGTFAVRGNVAPESVIPTIRRRVGDVDPTVPLENFRMLEDRLYDSLEEPRFNSILATVCAALAVLFVAVGLYGAISYSVSRRTLEFGVRAAIGARPGTILRLVLSQSARMTLIGAIIGLVLSIVLTRVLASLLFQVEPFDLMALSTSLVVVAGVAILASAIPAARASKISPMTALRQE